jgi:hypothetical protein
MLSVGYDTSLSYWLVQYALSWGGKQCIQWFVLETAVTFTRYQTVRQAYPYEEAFFIYTLYYNVKFLRLTYSIGERSSTA